MAGAGARRSHGPSRREVVGDARFPAAAADLERVLLGETVSLEQMLAQPSGEERGNRPLRAESRREGRVIGIYASIPMCTAEVNEEACAARVDAVVAPSQRAAAVLVGSGLAASCDGRRRRAPVRLARKSARMPIDAIR